MRPAQSYRIQEYLTVGGKRPFREWLETLDIVTNARIQARILRFESGNLGDTKSVGRGIFESRIDFGPGYRIYFGIDGVNLIILLRGGSKKNQKRDIRFAQGYWEDYLKRGRHGKTSSRME